jgi:hypothetical protein
VSYKDENIQASPEEMIGRATPPKEIRKQLFVTTTMRRFSLLKVTV